MAIYTLSEHELDHIQTESGAVYDLANVALALLESADISYRTRKNLQTLITAICDHNSQIHTMGVLTRYVHDQGQVQPAVAATVTEVLWVPAEGLRPARWVLTLRAEDGRELHTELLFVPGDTEALIRLHRVLAMLSVPPPAPAWAGGPHEEYLARQMTGRQVLVTAQQSGGPVTIAGPVPPPQPWRAA